MTMPRGNADGNRAHARFWRIALACAVLALAATCMAGCRVSDALTEVIYDQTADIIDYDNPTKIYINDSTADLESDQFAAREVSDDADVVSDTIQNLVVYSSTPNTEGFTAKKSVFGNPPDFKDIEASEEVCFVKSDDPDAFDHPLTVQEPEEEPEEEPEDEPSPQPQSTETSASGTDAPSAATGKSGGSKASDDNTWSNVTTDAGDGDGSQSGEGNPEGESPSPAEASEGGGNDNGKVTVAYDATDPTADPAEANSIAAFGPAATIVQMVGGAGALAATDAETLSSRFASVFDVADVKCGWSGDGSDVVTMDVDAILKSGAETVLVYQGDYLDGLSAADAKKLNDAGITQTVIYPLTNSGNIKQDVTVVGKILKGSDKAAYASETTDRAKRYRTFHDDVVKAATQANGGMLAGSKVYQSGSDAVAAASDASLYTLLVDEYDKSATYRGGGKSGFKPADGLAFSSAGYNTTPVSYYMQAGGAVNNAADKTNAGDTGKRVLWQFMPNAFTFKASEWSGSETTENAKIPSDYSLLTTTVNKHDIFPFGSSFGSDTFPKLVVTSPDIEDAILSNSAKENGAYKPYGFNEASATGSPYSMFGPVSAIPSCIGYDGKLATDENLFEGGQIEDGDIVVNPRGLFSDWTEGTVESFLESVWVNAVVAGGGADWKGYVTQFYADFYDYELTAGDWTFMDREDGGA